MAKSNSTNNGLANTAVKCCYTVAGVLMMKMTMAVSFNWGFVVIVVSTQHRNVMTAVIQSDIETAQIEVWILQIIIILLATAENCHYPHSQLGDAFVDYCIQRIDAVEVLLECG